ncbi:DNA polymerase III subunit alpha [Candidatus Dependentiae bacterium]|nr:DNA polymerase III subunit alpha [Candidatus Dependentiae bacterium]
MNQHFTHLHLHTEFSLLDGAIKLERLVEFGQQQKLRALAITDHGNLFGAVKFSQLCNKAGIKPIIGIEAYLTEDAAIKSADNKYYHLIILVQNDIGYQNLCKLIAFSFREGFYFKPRIDYKTLAKYSEGLIVSTACLGGHIPSLLMRDDLERVHQQIDWFLDIFGPERFYLEIQPEDQQEQTILNKKLYHLSVERDIPLLAAGDCHYPTAADRKAHEVMLCIQTHHKLTDPDRFTFGECAPWMRTAQEMLALFPGHEQAIWNSGKIADMCSFAFPTGKLFFPEFALPAAITQEQFFAQEASEGLQRLYERGMIEQASLAHYQERLHQEVSLITSMGFIGYLLVVSDFIRWAKNNNIPVGPGRGSAAGSLVAWALQITNIDPIKYNLLFERFLNPERVTMPDIDIDFCIEGREKVIQYVKDKYGHDNVCNIITFGTMMAKGVIKDVARVLGIPFEDANALTELIPDQLKITLQEAVEQEPRLVQMIANNPQVAELFDLAYRLEGLTRHASKHAAGIVISPQPIAEVLPIYIPPKSNDLVTQYAMTELEHLGFLKIDFLGLKNLTIVARALEQIAHNRSMPIDIDKIPLNDAATFTLIAQGKTTGVFQLESDGLQDVLKRLQPQKFEDIIAVNALYRPGPLGSGMVDDYIERRHGRQKISFIFPELEPILAETYGVIVYQEQVIKIASVIAGYSLGQADILRRAMGKKKAEVMAEQRQLFLQGAVQQGFDPLKSGELFDLMAFFAGYGFNKSHSAAYALIAYQTAYLKANYAAEFMAALISLEIDNPDGFVTYLAEARAMGLTIAQPNINKSAIDFIVQEQKIMFGLRGIKNVGNAALEDIIAQRSERAFSDLLDFCVRVDLRTCNKRVIENLICAGAFDQLPGNRAQKFHDLAIIIEQAIAIKQARKTGQMGLFSTIPSGTGAIAPYLFAARDAWSNQELLNKELEAIGCYMTAHPMTSHAQEIALLSCTSLNNIADRATTDIVCCGLLKNIKTIITKKGDPMAFVLLEDATGTAEVIVFPKSYAAAEPFLTAHAIVVVRGTVDTTGSSPKIKASHIVPLHDVYTSWQADLTVHCTLPTTIGTDFVKQLCTALPSGNSTMTILYQERDKKLQFTARKKIAVSRQLLQQLREQNVSVQLRFNAQQIRSASRFSPIS